MGERAMTLELSGLTFRATSPSRFELLSLRDDIGSGAKVWVEYNGSSWAVTVRMPSGHGITRLFHSRAAAIDIIAGRIG